MEQSPQHSEPSTRRPTLTGTVFGLILLATGVGTAAWLFEGAPGLRSWPDWFYIAVDKGSFDMLLVAAVAASLPWLVRTSERLARTHRSSRADASLARWAPARSDSAWPRGAGSARVRLIAAAVLVVVASALVQLAAGVVARGGVRGWTERFFVGHGEFSAHARNVENATTFLRDYETLAAKGQLGLYGPSKPPGTYAVYLAIDRTSRWTAVREWIEPLTKLLRRDRQVVPEQRVLFAWTILVLCSLAALTALPLVGLERALWRDEGGDRATLTYAAWLFVTAPVINVITVHLDSTLFPLLSATALCCCAWSMRVRGFSSPLLAAIGGGIGLFAVYCSYGNLPILALCGALMLALAIERRPKPPATEREREASSARSGDYHPAAGAAERDTQVRPSQTASPAHSRDVAVDSAISRSVPINPAFTRDAAIDVEAARETERAAARQLAALRPGGDRSLDGGHWRGAAIALLGFAAGILVLLLVLRLGLNWQPVAGYVRGVAYHKAWRPHLANVWRQGLAIVEFGLFAGPPLMLALATAFALTLYRAVERLRAASAKHLEPAPLGSWTITLGGVAIMLVIAFTLGSPEAGRLWLFMLPWFCVAAASGMSQPALWRQRHVLLFAQVALVFFVKNFLVW